MANVSIAKTVRLSPTEIEEALIAYARKEGKVKVNKDTRATFLWQVDDDRSVTTSESEISGAEITFDLGADNV